MSNNEKVQISIDKETYDVIQMLKEVLPAENGEQIDDNEVLKMVVGTFMAFIQGDDEEQDHNGCGCGEGHCH